MINKLLNEGESMKNLTKLAAFISLSLFLCLNLAVFAFGQEDVEKLHKNALVWDCHNDLVYRVLYEKLDIGNRLPVGHVDIPRLKKGHVDVQVVALFVQNFLCVN